MAVPAAGQTAAWVCRTCARANEPSYRHCPGCGGPRPDARPARTPAQLRARGLGLLAAGVAVMLAAGLLAFLAFTASSTGAALDYVLVGPLVLGAFMVLRGADVVVRTTVEARR